MSDGPFSFNRKVIIDTKEKLPWLLDFYGFDVEFQHLKYGDYSVQGFEEQFSLERKASSSELAANLGANYSRFLREMNGLKDYEVKYIICEFPKFHLDEYPEHTKMSEYAKQKALPASILLDHLEEIEDKYGIKTLFFNERYDAELYAVEILNAFLAKHK